MSEIGGQTTPEGDVIITKAQSAGPKSFSRTPSRIATDSLLHIAHIGEKLQRSPKTIRFVYLDRDAIFDSLVDMYMLNFKAKWMHLKHLLPDKHLPARVNAQTYYARVYITHWFQDLYAYNREACLRHEAVRSSNYYKEDRGINSFVYDNYLAFLLNSLRPTHIAGLAEDTLYVPVIIDTPFWSSTTRNYFALKHNSCNLTLFRAILHVMKDPSCGWLTTTVSHDPLGRPFWLFDWHENIAYAWFPEEENYNRDDQAAAYILGVSCTPLLASKDKDALQQYPENIIPTIHSGFKSTRVIEKRFHSMKDVRTHIEIPTIHQHTMMIEKIVQPDPMDTTEQGEIPTSPQVEDPGVTGAGNTQLVITGAHTPQTPATTPTQYTYDAVLNLFQIVDYKYYAAVTQEIDVNMRLAAHKIMIWRD